MSFLAPYVLGGLAAVGVPIAIHLLNKLRVRRTPWAAMRFLNEAVRSNQSKVRMDDFLLLLLRCLLVAAAVLAFARPVRTALGHGDGKGPVAAVVLLDHSASMARASGSVTCFDAARASIRSWLDTLDAGSSAGLFLAGTRPLPLIGTPSGDLALFRKSLEGATVSADGSDFSQALQLAVGALKDVTGLPKEIRLYTDGQAAAFRHRDELRRIAREHPDIVIRTITVVPSDSANLGLVSLRADGAVPSPGQPVRFIAEILNSGDAPATSVKVDFSADDKPAGSLTVPAIAPGETHTLTFAAEFASAGPHHVAATLPRDGFAADNRRDCALEVARRLDVLIAGPDDETAFFLARALAPVPRAQAGRYYLAPRQIAPAALAGELTGRRDDRAETVFLTDPSALDAASAAALGTFVEEGGNLVVLPGGSAAAWPDALLKRLPGSLGAAVETGTDAAPRAWQSDGFSHPVTRFWNDPANGNLGTVKFTRYRPMTLRPESNPAVLVAFSDGEPAVAACQQGRGSVVLINAGLSRDWTNFPLHPAFVPFLQRLMGHFHARTETRLNLTPGEAFRKSVDASLAGAPLEIRTPETATARSAGSVTATDGGAIVRYAATHQPGLYQIESAGNPLATFAVGLDPAESDLRAADPALFQELAEVPRGSASAGPGHRVVVADYWTAALVCVLALFLGEAAMAHRMSHAR